MHVLLNRFMQITEGLHFVQAEQYLVKALKPAFTTGLVFDNATRSPCQVHTVGHAERRYTGFMLVCDDPGPEYKYFAFTADFPEFSQGGG